jgi:hypothetical protein
MKIVMDSVNEITPELLSRTRTSRAVNGRAADPAASRVRERNLVLRQTCRVEGHTPVTPFFPLLVISEMTKGCSGAAATL